MEKILYKSLLKMKKASQEKIIDYVLLKCILNELIQCNLFNPDRFLS